MATVSQKFKFISRNVMNILTPIISDQKFIRLVKYLSNDPLALKTTDINNKVINQPDITNVDLIQDKTIRLTMFDSTIIEDSKIYLFFSPLRGNMDDISDILVDTIYVFDVIIPINNIVINGGLRQYEIASRVAELIDNQIFGAGRLRIISHAGYKVNENFQGITLTIKVNDIARTTK